MVVVSESRRSLDLWVQQPPAGELFAYLKPGYHSNMWLKSNGCHLIASAGPDIQLQGHFLSPCLFLRNGSKVICCLISSGN
uniref:Uncharacterized protein n=1 Tax=Arundo donax TaxID=35708 RepID=A0A0A9FS93_ARUDO